MGCSSSRDVRGDIEMPVVRASSPAAERRESLRPRPQSRAASALGSLGLCRSGQQSMHAYSALPLEAPAWFEEGPRHASRAPTRSPPAGGKRGLVEVLDDTESATSMTAHWPASATSSTAQWPASPSGSVGESSTPLQVLSVSDFDPAVMSGFRQTLAGPSHPPLLFPEKAAETLRETTEEPFDDMVMLMPAARDIPEVTGLVRARVNEFHEKLEARKKLKERADKAPDGIVSEEVGSPCLHTVVLYFTSIRGVRRTFEDGRAVRDILRCYRVRVDERDVSMHADFKDELRDLLGAQGLVLPRVFVPGDDVVVDLGGVDDVRALHEAGELAAALAGCEPLAGVAHIAPPCAGCGDMRFLSCKTCYGSCKLFAGSDEDGCLDGMVLRCPDCNENGLIRCLVCCSRRLL